MLAPYTSLGGELPSGLIKPIWSALEEELVGKGTFPLISWQPSGFEGLSSKLSLCVHWNDHLGRPSAGCSSPSYVTSSWSDRMLVTSVSLTHNFWPSWETFWLARNLLTMKSPAWLPRTLRRPWGRSSQASYRSYKVMRTSFIWCCLLLTTFHPEVCE